MGLNAERNRCACRGEANRFHRPLAFSCGLMGVLGAVVQIAGPAMLGRGQQFAVRDLVAAQLIGDEHARHILQSLEEPPEELLGGHSVSAGLDQDVESVAVVVDGAPKVAVLSVYPDEHLVHMPLVTQ